MSKENCIVMKTGIGIVSNKNVVCEKELIRNSLLPLSCLTAFSFLSSFSWGEILPPRSRELGRQKQPYHAAAAEKQSITAQSRRLAGSLQSGLVALLAGSNMVCQRGSLSRMCVHHTHKDWWCTYDRFDVGDVGLHSFGPGSKSIPEFCSRSNRRSGKVRGDVWKKLQMSCNHCQWFPDDMYPHFPFLRSTRAF